MATCNCGDCGNCLRNVTKRANYTSKKISALLKNIARSKDLDEFDESQFMIEGKTYHYTQLQ